jgi:transaldolase / glucose-6-phosphate isomerase
VWYFRHDMEINSLSYRLDPTIKAKFDEHSSDWDAQDKIARIWARDASVWTGSDESNWLDWLDIVAEERANISRYDKIAKDISQAGFSDVLLMGMGGSSLCPEVLALTFGKDNFHILDSTVPAQVKAIEDKISVHNTLFIVASKSGSTLEPNCFKQYFFDLVTQRRGREAAGQQFIAITDPGSKMEKVAREDGFRHIVYGKPAIGGRFSALSAFGLTAASAMGLKVGDLLESAERMVSACRTEKVEENPGAQLGLLLGSCHADGRDKLTISTSPEIQNVGAWLEQLIAESTGKNGVAIIPVDREPHQNAADYSSDRVFVFLNVLGSDPHSTLRSEIEELGHPVIRIELASIADVGQEFFRWEFATAVAGAVMRLNPFDQPDVESAKVEARKITEEFEQTGTLPAEEPFYSEIGTSLFSGDKYADELMAVSGSIDLKGVLRRHIRNIGPGDYFALLAYLQMNTENEQLLTAIRQKVLMQAGTATCLGFGPRFLHSTGQAYKGGANNGVFLQITSEDEFDITVPQQKFTFGVVKSAQARGDFQVLVDRGRRALRVHLGTDLKGGLQRLLDLI